MTFPRAPRVLKGAFVQLERSSAQPRVIGFQYNPEKLLRRIDESRQSRGRASPAESPREVITCTLELDATDALERPDDHPEVGEHGIYPTLSALELLMRPRETAGRRSWLQRLFGARPDPGAIVLFVWGAKRVVPVRLTRLTVDESLHSPELVPLRASVKVAMQVLRAEDFPRGHWGRDIAARHATMLKDLAGRALDSTPPVDLHFGKTG